MYLTIQKKESVKKMNKISQRRAGWVAVVLVLAMIFTGTWAWTSNAQRAFNTAWYDFEPDPRDTNYGGRVHDNYDGVGAGLHNKDVYVETFGENPLFVRVRLSEFLSINGIPVFADMFLNDTSTWVMYLSQPNNVHAPRADERINKLHSDLLGGYGISWTLGQNAPKYFMPTHNHAIERANIIQPSVPDLFAHAEAFHMTEATGRAVDAIAYNEREEAFDPTAITHASDLWSNGFQTGPGDGTHNWATGETHEAPLIYTERNGIGLVELGNAGLVKFTAQPTLTPYIGLNAAGMPVLDSLVETTLGLDDRADFVGVMTIANWINLGHPAGNFWILDVDGWFYWNSWLGAENATSLLLDAIYLPARGNDSWQHAIEIEGEFFTPASIDGFDLTLEARSIFEQEKEVIFDVNGGVLVGENTRSVQNGQSIGVENFPTNPTRTGYAFAGWWTAAIGGTEVTETTPIIATQTVIARWTANADVVVTFDSNGGSEITPNTRTVQGGLTIGAANFPANPTRTGYAFAGWWTAAIGGTQVTAITPISATQTVTARWKANTYSVTFVPAVALDVVRAYPTVNLSTGAVSANTAGSNRALGSVEVRNTATNAVVAYGCVTWTLNEATIGAAVRPTGNPANPTPTQSRSGEINLASNADLVERNVIASFRPGGCAATVSATDQRTINIRNHPTYAMTFATTTQMTINRGATAINTGNVNVVRTHWDGTTDAVLTNAQMNTLGGNVRWDINAARTGVASAGTGVALRQANVTATVTAQVGASNVRAQWSSPAGNIIAQRAIDIPEMGLHTPLPTAVATCPTTGPGANIWTDTTGIQWCVVNTQTVSGNQYSMLVARNVHNINAIAPAGAGNRNHSTNAFVAWPTTTAGTGGPESRTRIHTWFNQNTITSPALRARTVNANIPVLNNITTPDAATARNADTTALSTPIAGSMNTTTPVFFLSQAEITVRMGQTTNASRITHLHGTTTPNWYWFRSAGHTGIHVAMMAPSGEIGAGTASAIYMDVGFRPVIWVRR